MVRVSLPEHLHLEHIGGDFLRLTIDIGVNERYIVIACYHVSEGR